VSTKLLLEEHQFMKHLNKIPLGIIEGFFGRSWSNESRENYASFLAQHQFDFYIYAPKDDTNLRRKWQEDWPRDIKIQLGKIRQVYAEKQIEFGVGLSPLEIWRDNQDTSFSLFKKRIAQINDLTPDILCILFDDMRGDLPELAKIQIELAHIAADISHAEKIIFCPSYYSTDPVLEKVFGKIPENYWKDLGQKLDSSIDIFWTGEKVCSNSYSSTHLQWIESQFNRKVFLWDNYPVNDGAIKSQRLHLLPAPLSHQSLSDRLNGHAANPMNQAALSQIPLLSLARAYHNHAQLDTEKIFFEIAGTKLGQELLNDADFFQTEGLKNLDVTRKREYIARYQKFSENPLAIEVIEWLNGKYTFDPACLTE